MEVDHTAAEAWKQKIWCAINDNDEDVNCDICLDDFNDESIEGGDNLVICDMCNVAVHQSCYGHDILRKFPETEQWFCERCIEL
jgi:NuA3 HAT complex component NTO1